METLPHLVVTIQPSRRGKKRLEGLVWSPILVAMDEYGEAGPVEVIESLCNGRVKRVHVRSIGRKFLETFGAAMDNARRYNPFPSDQSTVDVAMEAFCISCRESRGGRTVLIARGTGQPLAVNRVSERWWQSPKVRESGGGIE